MFKILSTLLIVCLLSSFQLTAQTTDVRLHDHVHELKQDSQDADNHKFAMPMIENEVLDQIKSKRSLLTLPFRHGYHEFTVQEFSIYGKKSPWDEIKTYRLVSATDPTITGRIVTGPLGVNLTYLDKTTLIKVYPVEENGKRNYYQSIGFGPESQHDISCGSDDHISEFGIPDKEALNEGLNNGAINNKGFGQKRRRYRVGVVVTGEYYQGNGNSAAAVSNAAIGLLSDISAIYEREVNVELMMADGAPYVGHRDPSTDPFTDGGDRTQQAQDATSEIFDDADYDIGHVFHTMPSGGSGVARLGVVCTSSKGYGWSGFQLGDPARFARLACHEFGHQFNCPHTYNGDGANCAGNQHPANTAYEIASGTTMMSYNGICGEEYNIPSGGRADDYFHANSLNQMTTHMDTWVCNEDNWVQDTNNPPVADANPCDIIHRIPRSTPFFLTGEASDADGDRMTYSWEQYDEDGVGVRPTHGFIGSEAAGSKLAPLFRCYPPTSSLTRHFPKRSTQLTGINADPYEVLPRVNRNIKFRFVVRDNNPNGGAVDWEQITVKVVDGTFKLTSPNEGNEVYNAGETIEVRWNANGPDELCEKIEIRLSNDGGASYPFVLMSDVDFTAGIANVQIPASFSQTDKARIQIACADHDCFSFYDFSDDDFVINSSCNIPNASVCDESLLEVDFSSPELNLGTLGASGNALFNYSKKVDVNDLNQGRIVLHNTDRVSCTAITPENPFELITIVPTVSGNYTINFPNVFESSATSIFTVFDKASYTQSDPCASFIASNSFRTQSFSATQSLTANLEACKEYYLAYYVTQNARTNVFIGDISGPGILIAEDGRASETAYVAVNANTGLVVAANTDGNFQSLDPGSFEIHSINYAGGSTAAWIGMTLAQIQNIGDCLSISGNFKPIDINSSCAINQLITDVQGECDPTNNTFQQSFSFQVDLGPSTGTVTINDQNFPLVAGTNTVTLSDLPANGEIIDLSFSFSDDAGCVKYLEAVFTAPENCCPIDLNLENQSVCSEDIPELDAGNDGITYEWFLDGFPTTFNSAKINPTEGGTYRVVVTDFNGCQKTDQATIAFNEPPIVDIITTEIPDLCEGDPFLIRVDTENVDSTRWFLNNERLVGQENKINVVARVAGFYKIEVFRGGCSRTDDIFVPYRPTPEFSLGDDIIACDSEEIITLEADVDSLTYVWTKLNPNILQGSTTNILEVTEEGRYEACGTNSFGCESCEIIRVRIEEVPDLDLGDDTFDCPGEYTRIEAEEFSGAVTWYYNDEEILNYTNPWIAQPEPGQYVIEFFISEDCQVTDTLIVSKYPFIDVELGPDLSFCEGADIDVDLFAGPFPSPDFSYNWFKDFNEIPNIRGTQNVTEPGYYQVRVRDKNNGCEFFDDITIEYVESPTVELPETIDPFCRGDEVTIRATSSDDGISWYLDDVLVPSLSGPTVEVTLPGVYRAVIADGQDCEASDQVELTELPFPGISVDELYEGCEGSNVTIDASPEGNYNYVWLQDGSPITGATESSYVASMEGEYIVIARNAEGCNARDTAFLRFIDAFTLEVPEMLGGCDGETLTIVAETNAPQVTWLQGTTTLPETSRRLDVTMPGTYEAVVGDGDCELRGTVVVDFSSAPDIDLGEDTRTGCLGDEITLIAGPDGAYTYEWKRDGAIVATDDTGVYTALVSGTYVVTARDQNLCEATDQVVVDLEDAPFVTAEETEYEFCEGSGDSLIVQSNVTDVTWYLGNMLLPDTELGIVVTEEGDYRVVVGEGTDCEDSETISVTLIEAPEVELGPDRGGCSGDMVELVAGEDGENFYDWSLDGVIQASSEEGTYIAEVSGLYTVRVINDSNCSTTDSVRVTLVDAPFVEAVQEKYTFCAGEVGIISVASNIDNVTWIFRRNELADRSLDLGVTEPGTYEAKVGDGPPCEDIVTIEVEFLEAPEIEMNDDISLCAGDEEVVTAGDDGEYTYTWTSDNVILQEGEMGSYTINADGTYIVTASNDADCTSADTIIAVFTPAPFIEITSQNDYCVGETAVITTNSNSTVLAWFLDDVLIEGESGTELAITMPGTYRGVVGLGQDCEESDEIEINFNPAPDINIEQEADSACTGDDYLITAGDDGLYTYTWTFEDGTEIKTGDEGNVLVTQSGDYYLLATNTDGCDSRDTITLEFLDAPTVTIDESFEFCGNDVAVITANTSSAVVTWFYENEEIEGETSPMLVVTDPGEYEVFVGLGLSCDDNASTIVSFIDNPEIDIEEDTDSACTGDDYLITAGDDGLYTYTWTYEDGTEIKTGAEGNVLVTQSGDYYVLAVNAEGCESADTITLEFLDAPTVSIDATYSFCENDVAVIMANSSSPIVTWFYDGVEIEGENSPMLVVTDPGEYQVFVGLGLACDDSATTMVSFSDNPVITELVDDQQCEDTEIVINAGMNPDYTYSWTLDGTGLMEETGVLVLTSDLVQGVGEVIVTVVDTQSGCMTLDSATVEFLETPSVVVMGDQEFCIGDVTASISADTNAGQLTWFQDGVVLPETGTTLAVSATGTYTAVAGLGLQCSDRDSIDVVFLESPDISIDSETKCAGDIAVFNAGPDDFTYVWTVGGIESTVTTGILELSEDEIVGTSATVTVVAVNSANCTKADTATVSFVEVAELSTLFPVIDLCQGEDAVIVIESNAGSLDWFRGNDPLVGETGLTLVVSEPGIYRGVAGLGEECESEIEVEVNPLPTPSLEIEGPEMGCEGEDLFLTANTDAASVVWSTNGMLLSEETTYEVTASGTYDVTVTSADNCTATTSQRVEFFSLPTATIDDLPTGECEGVDLPITAESDGVRFEWHDDDGPISGATDLVQVFSTTGSYAFYAYNAADCPTIVEFDLEFIPSPTVDITEELIEVCEDEPVMLSISAETAVTYQWYQDGNILTGETSESITVTASGAYELIATNSINCTSSDVVEVIFTEYPTIMIEDTAVSFCEGEDVDLEIMTGGSEISWTLDNVSVGENTQTITVDQPGTYDIEVTDNGCTSTAEIVVDEISVLPIEIADVELCPNDDPSIITISDDFTTYVWTGGSVSSTTNVLEIPYQVVSEITTETITVTATNDINCSTSASFDVTYFPALDVSVPQDVYEVCAGESVQLSVLGGSVYEWTDNSGTLSSTTTADPVATPTETTVYDVMISDICPDNFEIVSIQVIVNPLPEANAGDDRSVIPGRTAQLEATGGVTYSWDNTDLIIGSSTVSDPEFELDSSTVFTVTVTDANGCTDTDEILIDVIDDITVVVEQTNGFSPNGDNINDELEFKGLELFPDNRLTIFNRWGNIVFERRRYQSDDVRWDGTRSGEPLPADTYFYILEFEGQKYKSSITLLRN